MIYIERNIEIKNNAATIEEPIILYKGDKNVEVNFIIENSPYKHRAGIETTYGQLVIKRPSSAPIFSDVAKVSNGKVLFIVSGDMIDELEELGSYDFQIRLINAEMTSRATLPPVTGGIVIKEPICEETTLNRSRINDRSYVVTSNAPEDVFNESGAYNMLNWQNGDIITDAKMNHIDTAIYEINDVKIDMTALYDYATKEELNTATSDLWASTYEEFQSKADLNHAHEEYITEHQDISHLVIQDEYNDDMYGLSLRVEEIERAGYITEGYVDEAISKIEIPEPDLSGYATNTYVKNYVRDYTSNLPTLNIKTIGDGEKVYKFTGDEFTKEEYGLQWEGDVFFNKVRIGDWTYNEIVQIHCLFEMGTWIDDQYIEGNEFIIYTKRGFQYFIIDKDGVIHFIKSNSGSYMSSANLSDYGYATKDELQAALGNIENLLGGI